MEYLPKEINCRNVAGATAKSVAGISLLTLRAQGRSFEALFLCPLDFMADTMGALRRAVSRSGKANPVVSATLLISLIGGSSLVYTRASSCGYCALVLPSIFLRQIISLVWFLPSWEGFLMLNRNYSGTPEHYLRPAAVSDRGDLDVDALQCALSRAEALCILLVGQFDGSSDRCSDKTLGGAVWALEGVIGQAQLLVRGGDL